MLWAAGTANAATGEGAVISNGTVQLGVTKFGSLNYNCVSNADPVCPAPSATENVDEVGLRFQPLNLDSTSPGCLCEGWGVADAAGGLTGSANEASGNVNVTVDSFSSPSPDRAVSTVTVADPALPGFQLQVTQDYAPTALSPNFFLDTVTVTNTGSNPVADLRYRRVMDWDVEPTAFSEYVTSKGTSAQLLFNSDDGFATADPLAGPSYIDSEVVCGPGYTGVCEYTDLGSGGTFAGGAGPDDIGGLYDFGFGALNPGESRVFTVLYGAAPGETDAINALTAIGAQIYSLGESSCTIDAASACQTGAPDAGPNQGKPVTFMFAFNTASADVEIVKTASAERINPGLDLTYTLAVKNNGPETSNGVIVTDPLPAGATLKSATSTQGACSGTTTVTCDLGALAAGAAVNVEVVVAVTKDAGKSLTNTATVAALTGDSNKANNSSTAVTDVGKKKSSCRGITVNGLGIQGTDKSEKLKGSKKSDQIRGAGGKDKIKGDKAADCLIGQSGSDKIKGQGGNDVIRAGSKNDKVSGGPGDDEIRAQDGNDKVNAGSGNDTIKLQGQGVDKLNCGSGKDKVIGDSKDKIKGSCEKLKIVGRK
jgi:uncharacterized repeat protein (TIGR01451 family)